MQRQWVCKTSQKGKKRRNHEKCEISSFSWDSKQQQNRLSIDTWCSQISCPSGLVLKAMTFQSGTETLMTRSKPSTWVCEFECVLAWFLVCVSVSSWMTRCASRLTSRHVSPLGASPSRKLRLDWISGTNFSSKFPTLKFHLTGRENTKQLAFY